jgi:hypothetical protein
VALVAAAAVGLLVVAFAPPGGEDTIPEPDGRTSPADTSTELLAILRAPWDSEAKANWPVAETMGSISEASYLTPVEAHATFDSLGFRKVSTFLDASMIGYVMSIDDVTVIVFRGTDDARDWIASLNRFTVDTPHGKAHRGFYDAYQRLKPQIIAILRQNDEKHVWITGHSLGGALAVLCAYDLIENEGANVSGVITFGQPMVARAVLAKHLDSLLASRYAHLVNEADVVPRIPPSCRHCGSLVWYTGGGIRRSARSAESAALPAGAGEQTAPGDEEIQPLSSDEFDKLQADLRREASAPETAADGSPLPEGSSRLIADHAMALYLEKVRLFLTR